MKSKLLLLFTFIFSFAFAQNNALVFDGVDEHITTTYAGVLGNADRTVEAWVKIPANNPTTQKIVTDYGEFNSPNGRRFTLNILAQKARIEVRGWGINGTTNLNDNAWHHLVVVYNGADNYFELYVDGMVEASGIPTVTINTTGTVNFQMGARIDGANYFLGEMDEVRFWSTARRGSEILATKDVELVGNEQGLVAYYNFNNAVLGANGVPDLTAGAHPGTMVNFEVTDIIPSTAPVMALPVELVSFTGRAIDKGDVALNWATASEKDNAYFEIQRTTKLNAEWEQIGKIEGAGTSYGPQTYDFVDKYADSGINYYRLNQVDFSGISAISKIIVVEVDRKEQGEIVSPYPNPTTGVLYFPTTNFVELFSLEGKLLKLFTPIDDALLKIDISEYPSGLYFLKSDYEVFSIDKN